MLLIPGTGIIVLAIFFMWLEERSAKRHQAEMQSILRKMDREQKQYRPWSY